MNQSCDDGDSTLFNGLLCASGEMLACKAVKDSQDSDGRWWRSPRYARREASYAKNSFSRDMSMGVLLYLVTTRDKEAAKKWIRWIENERPCVIEQNFDSNCTIKGLERFCRDEVNQVCTLTPGSWAIMKEVWQYLGIDLHPKMKGILSDWADKLLATEVKLTDPGYELHLKGVTVFLKEKMNVRKTQRTELINIILENSPKPFLDT